MQTFSFTVITDGADIMTDESYKMLLDAGCDDATIGSANGVQYVHFDRDAETLGEAVVSAIRDIESVKGVNVVDVNTSDAALLGTTVGGTVALAVRRLRQDEIGAELRGDLTEAEADWLDADLG